MDEMVRKREEEEDQADGAEIPPELLQLAGALVQAFLTGDRESVEALYEMYHEPDRFVERQRNVLREMLRELLADGKITPEEAQQLQKELSAGSESKDSKESADAVNAGNAGNAVNAGNAEPPPAQSQDGGIEIPADKQRVANPKGRTLHEIMGISR